MDEDGDLFSGISSIWKRKHEETKSSAHSPDGLKKARFTWQLKGQKRQQSTFTSTADSNEHSPSREHYSSQSTVSDMCHLDNITSSSNEHSSDDSNDVSNSKQRHSDYLESTDLSESQQTKTFLKECENKQQTESEQNASTCSDKSVVNKSCGITDRFCSRNVTNVQESSTSSGSYQSASFLSRNPQDGHQGFFQQDSNYQEERMKRWQAINTAGAVVDNAINATLEQMGLSPNKTETARARTFFQTWRSQEQLEQLSIMEAIEQQGLVIPSCHKKLLNSNKTLMSSPLSSSSSSSLSSSSSNLDEPLSLPSVSSEEFDKEKEKIFDKASITESDATLKLVQEEKESGLSSSWHSSNLRKNDNSDCLANASGNPQQENSSGFESSNACNSMSVLNDTTISDSGCFLRESNVMDLAVSTAITTTGLAVRQASRKIT